MMGNYLGLELQPLIQTDCGRHMFKSTRLKTWFKWVTERHQSNHPKRWCTSC